MLFTAIAATVVLLPLAVGSTGDRDDHPASVADTHLAQQPLVGLGGGVTVREISQATTFSMVALTGGDLTGTSARVRARRADGSWGKWYATETLPARGDGPAARPRGTDPVFVGATTTVQIAVSRPAGAPTTSAPKTAPAPDLGYIPATSEQPLAQNISAILISPPQAPADTQWNPPTAIIAPGQAPAIIARPQWGADPAVHCGNRPFDQPIRAAVVHHTAESNDYQPQDSAAIVQSIWAYHTQILGWCDIAYNALVDKYGQVFEGRAGALLGPVQGDHTGGFNREAWGVAMIGNFDDIAPTPIQLHTTGRLIGWRLGMDHVDPRGTVPLASEGGENTNFPFAAVATLPTVFAHRDVGATDCPGNVAYGLLDEIRDTAAHFSGPPRPEDLALALQGGAIFDRWQAIGGASSMLGAPTSPEATGNGESRYVTFERGAMYWSPETGPQSVTGAIYDAWASLGYERGALGLPTSSEIQEPQWVKQNFQHGTLNFNRVSGRVTRVADGVVEELPPPTASGPPVQVERFSPVGPAV
ncbi:N-acetylmuramoyl-L-alanine amidase [Candidatus Mycobacterium wuenschmannii]